MLMLVRRLETDRVTRPRRPSQPSAQIKPASMPLLTLDSVSLAFGHLPLFEAADLRIEPGERIALIGRNGTGKSSLLGSSPVRSRRTAARSGAAPGVRIARLDQDVPGSGERTVFDEVATGLGELGALVGDYHHAAVRVAERPTTPLRSSGSAKLQHQLEERDGWRLEQKVETGRVAAGAAGRPADARAVRRLAPARAARQGAGVASRTCCCSTSRPTISTSTRSAGSRSTCGTSPARCCSSRTTARSSTALATRIIELDRGRLTSWPGSYRAVSREEGGRARHRSARARAAGQEAREGGGLAAAGRQGAADAQRRARARR